MLQGRCHCGQLSWRLDRLPESVLACNCSICHRYGALWAYGHLDVDVKIFGDAKSYQRPDNAQVSFQFCGICGGLTHYVAIIDDHERPQRCAVNLRMCALEEIAQIPVRHFDGANSWASLPSQGKRISDLWA